MAYRFFSRRTFAAPFGRYQAGNEAEPPADEVLVGRQGQRAYFIDLLLRSGRRGAYLVTGQRGVGKSSFVRYCLNEYQQEVFERFLQSNVGRATFWDRILVMLLVAVLLLIALMTSELVELLSIGLSGWQGPRRVLPWIILAPLVVLGVYPALYAVEITRSVIRAAKVPFASLTTATFLVASAVLIWTLGPFGAPAVSMSRLLCALSFLYLFTHATSYRPEREGWRFGRRSGWTTAVLIVMFCYVFLLPSYFTFPLPYLEAPSLFGGPYHFGISDYTLTPMREFQGNLALSFWFAGLGCFLQGRYILRLNTQNGPPRDHRPIYRAYLRSGLGLIGLGLLYPAYFGRTWFFAVAFVVWVVAELLFRFRLRGERSEPELRMRFASQPLIVLLFKAFLAIVVCLQLIHPAISRLPSASIPLVKEVVANEPASPAVPSPPPGPSTGLSISGVPDSELREATSLWSISGLRIGEDGSSLSGMSVFDGTEEELRWILTLFLLLVALFYIEYEWIVRPFLRRRTDGVIEPPGPGTESWMPNERHLFRELAEVSFPWHLFKAWLPVIITSVNLGFERLDHRRVVHAMLASLRSKYYRAFLAWNSPVANLGRLLGLLLLLSLVVFAGERWFAMPSETTLDSTVLRKVAEQKYQNICDSFTGRQEGAGAVNFICKLKWGSRIYHVLTYNLATSNISSSYRSDHLLFSFLPYLDKEWPTREYIQKTLEPGAKSELEPLFERGINVRVYHVLLFAMSLLIGRFILRRVPVFPYREALKKIDEVTDQILASTSITSTTGLPQPSNWLRGFFIDERVRQVQQDPLDPRTVELVFLQILGDIQSSTLVLPGARNQLFSLPTPEVTFVFDELDKLGSRVGSETGGLLEGEVQQREIINAERRRSAELHALLADLKNLLSSAPARFIFVGGRNLHDEWLADQTARQPLLTNIFNAEVYLPSLLTDYSRREKGGMHRNVVSYLRWQVRRAKKLYETSWRFEMSSPSALPVRRYLEESFVPVDQLEPMLDSFDGDLQEAIVAFREEDTKIAQWMEALGGDVRECLGRVRRAIGESAPDKRLLCEAYSLRDRADEVERTLRQLQENVLERSSQALQAVRDLSSSLSGLQERLANGAVCDLQAWIERVMKEVSHFEGSLDRLQDIAVLSSLKSLVRAAASLSDCAGALKSQAGQSRSAVDARESAIHLAQSLQKFFAEFEAKYYDDYLDAVDRMKRAAGRLRSLPNIQDDLEVFAVEDEDIRLQAANLSEDFVKFLAYRSKGNPKRLKELLSTFVRPVGRVVDDPAVRQRHFLCDHVLLLDDVARFRIQMISLVYSHLYSLFEARLLHQDDKLAMTVLFLSDFVLKFHRRAFSWSNLERVDEIVHIHRAPDLRDTLEKLVTNWTVHILHPIRNGMYDFRFLSEVAREIEFISRESQEEMAAFNFTLDESLTMKSVYETTIQRLSENRGKEVQDLVAGLGELYEFDQEYETARFYYRKANSLLDQDLRDITGGGEMLETDSPALEIIGAMAEGQRNARLYMTWGIRRLRLMMQIGMTFELANNYEQAQVEYRNAYTLARALLLSMLDERGRQRAVDEKIARGLPPQSDERVQELKHLTLLFQPAFAEAWLGEKLIGAVDTSAALIERELWQLRKILPFVREDTKTASASAIDVTHSNFGLIMSDLHNKAGDLYFMKGRQLIGLAEVQGNVEAKEKERPRRGEEGYLLQAHYHYCTALHFLKLFISDRRESSRQWLNIWPVLDERWPTLSKTFWPAFVYSAAGEAFSDLGDGMIARVSYAGLLHCLAFLQSLSRGSETVPEEDAETADDVLKKLIQTCTEWLEGSDMRAETVRFALPVRGQHIPAGTMGGWLGVWQGSDSGGEPLRDERLLRFDEWKEHDDEARLGMAVNFMLTGAKYLERGGYLEDAARQYLKACETVSYYLWWGLAASRLFEWVMVPEKEDKQLIGFREIFKQYLKIPEKGDLPCQEYWIYLAELGIYGLINADRLFGRSRDLDLSGKPEYIVGADIPPFALTLACSLGLAANLLDRCPDPERKLAGLLSRWLGREEVAGSSENLRETLSASLVRHSYPTVNRLHGLMVLIQDAVLGTGAPGDPETPRQIMSYALELKELNSRFEAPMFFTPFSSGVAYGLAYIYCRRFEELRRATRRNLTPGEEVIAPDRLEEIRRAAQKDLTSSEEMITLRGTYYANVSRLYYLYDDFNDRQLHFNHAIQMAGSELALLLKYVVNLQDRRGRSTDPLAPRTPEPPGTTSRELP